MNKEYIEREAVIEKCNLLIESLTAQRDQYIQHIIGGIGLVRELILIDEETAVPSADVAPIVHAKWEKEKWTQTDQHICSLCHSTVRVHPQSVQYKYCPYCGAKMKED